MSKKNKKESATITYDRAISALRVINPVKNMQGKQVRGKSDISSIKGDIGMQVYHLKHDIKDAAKPFDDKNDAIIEDLKLIRAEINKIKKEKEQENEDSKKDSKDSKTKKEAKKAEEKTEEPASEFEGLSEEELNAKGEELIRELEDLFKMEIEIEFTKGKLLLEDVKNALDSDEYEVLKFAIKEN